MQIGVESRSRGIAPNWCDEFNDKLYMGTIEMGIYACTF